MASLNKYESFSIELKNKITYAKDIKFIKSGIEITIETLNDFPKTMRILKSQGFIMKDQIKPLTYFFSRKSFGVTVRVLEEYKKFKCVYPNYKNSMLNICESIKAYYNKEIRFNTIKELDKAFLKYKPKHVVFMILDGMGYKWLNSSLNSKSFLRSNISKKISTVFPSTTSSAIPVSKSSKMPIETGWIGWENYFNDLKRSLVMFTGKDYFTGEMTNINVREKYLPYDNFYESLGVPFLDIEPEFDPLNGVKTFKEGLDKMIKFQKENDKTFTYFYTAEPDSTLHKFGTKEVESIKVLKDINQDLTDYKDLFLDDTMFIITADHGHQNVKHVDLRNFKDIMSLLERVPSNESRALCFEVRNGKKEEFKKLFNLYFRKIYKLYDKKEFLEKGFLGKFDGHISKRLSSFLGDFIAVAISDYYFIYSDLQLDQVMASTHAGMTKNEMEVPLIVYHK